MSDFNPKWFPEDSIQLSKIHSSTKSNNTVVGKDDEGNFDFIPLTTQYITDFTETVSSLIQTQSNLLSYIVDFSSSPPLQPQENTAYIVHNGIDEWKGYDNSIAFYTNDEWQYIPPQMGMSCHIGDNQEAITFYNGYKWITLQEVHTPFIVYHVVSEEDIINKYIELEMYPSILILFIEGAPFQQYGIDYRIEGNRVYWDNMGLDGKLEVNEHITMLLQ